MIPLYPPFSVSYLIAPRGKENFLIYLFLDQNKRKGDESFGMSRSSFASFHLTGIKSAGTGKVMQSSVDRLFENEGDVFLSNTFNDFQVILD